MGIIFIYSIINLFSNLGDTVFAQGAAATPNVLLEAMTHHAKENNLKDIKVIHMHTEGKFYRHSLVSCCLYSYFDKLQGQHCTLKRIAKTSLDQFQHSWVVMYEKLLQKVVLTPYQFSFTRFPCSLDEA